MNILAKKPLSLSILEISTKWVEDRWEEMISHGIFLFSEKNGMTEGRRVDIITLSCY